MAGLDAAHVSASVAEVIALHLPDVRRMSSPCDESRRVQRVRCTVQTVHELMHWTTEGRVIGGWGCKKFCAK
jgi:hypothetical protein